MQAIIAAYPGFGSAGADPLLLPLLPAAPAASRQPPTSSRDLLRTVYDKVHDESSADAVETAQARINAYRTPSNSYVQIPTIKAMVGLKTGNPARKRTRAVDADQRRGLRIACRSLQDIAVRRTTWPSRVCSRMPFRPL